MIGPKRVGTFGRSRRHRGDRCGSLHELSAGTPVHGLWLQSLICSPWECGGILMKCRAAAVAALLCAIFANLNAEARGPYGSISVGNWQGGAYTNDQTGSFSHCAAGARYASGIYFMVTIDGNGGWGLGFMHEQWTLTPGQAFPLTLTFDGQQPFNVHGVPIGDKLVRVPMPSNSSLIAQFRRAKAMTAYKPGQLFQFNLDQTGQLLP